MKEEQQPGSLPARSRRWHTARRTIVGLACFVTLIALFYTVENWRGRQAWENCKRELEAKGELIDWTHYIPAPVPADQNIFDAPHMNEWFVGRGSTDLSRRLSPDSLADFVGAHRPMAVLTVVPPETEIAPDQADLVLEYENFHLREVTMHESSAADSAATAPVIPRLIIDDVPLTTAIANLSKQAAIRYVLDPTVPFGRPGPDGKPIPEPTVSIRWENVTARQALISLLQNYDLQLVETANGVAQIRIKNPDQLVQVDPAVQQRLANLIANAARQSATPPAGLTLRGPQEFTLSAETAKPADLARILVRARTAVTTNELAAFFRGSTTEVPRSSGAIRVAAAGSNAFHLFSKPQWYAAADYLEWSTRYAPEFDLIRDALKRPYARMNGDYRQPMTMPIPNFVSLRLVAQTLAQRAQCHLLLGQPEAALRELTLLHDLGRLCPEVRPTTLVAAMIDVAVVGLYLDTIADGERLHAWREPQLAELQKQLAEINLPVHVKAAFRTEQAGSGYTLQTVKLPTLLSVLRSSGPGSSPEIPSLQLLGYSLMPRGWIYQNIALHATLLQPAVHTYDDSTELVLPERMNAGQRQVESIDRWSPYSFLSAWILPNYARAWHITARTQSRVHMALIACALERHRLAHDQYPETPAALVPQFLDHMPHDPIGGQPLKYRRTDGGFILYSIGWNQTDDGGISSESPSEADWVWEIPKPAAP